jgi:Lipase (class 3)
MEKAHQVVDGADNPAQAVQYGQLVQTAYDMYNGGQGGLTPTPPTPFPGGFTFIAWIQMKDFFIQESDWTFYGFIVQRSSKANEFVLAIRGTGDDTEWWDDLTSMVPVPWAGFGKVGYGFNRIYQTLRVVNYVPSEARGAEVQARAAQPTGTFAEQVASVVREHSKAARPRDNTEAPSAAMSIEVTGHSLGGALATLYVAENTTTGRVTIPLICTFASPRVGDPTFAAQFDRLEITSWRIVNEPDLVPKLPFLGFQHIEVEHTYNSGGSVEWTLACWHSLSTYLHLLDPNQPLCPECIWPPKMATVSLREGAKAVQARKRVALGAKQDEGTTININITIT